MRATFLMAPVFVAALGCGSPQQQQLVGKCKTNADCKTDQVCNTHGDCQTTFGCHADTECAANQTCDKPSGVCLCANDQGCNASQFCNASKRCQTIGACQANADCPTGKICNSLTQGCIDAASCSGTLQCPLGEICDSTQSKCVAGCKSTGDCPQTDAGVNGIFFAPQACISGQCQASPACTETIGCGFGQVCSGSNTCTSACSGGKHYCTPCDPANGGSECGSGTNFCLEDPRNDASCTGVGQPGCKFWCGVDCSGGKACPAGYDCSGVVVVTSSTMCNCGVGATCSNGNPCICGEGATSGYCNCNSDFDCGGGIPSATCQNGNCTIGSDCYPTKGFYCDAPGPQCP